jgi:hypothetical protein
MCIHIHIHKHVYMCVGTSVGTSVGTCVGTCIGTVGKLPGSRGRECGGSHSPAVGGGP